MISVFVQMARRVKACGRCFLVFGFLLPLSSSAQDKITYQDHILPLVEANCSKCHNADKKKADLDLTSYQGALKGSGSGVVVLSGNVDGSKIWKALTHSEEPYMPPNRPRLDDKELDLFKKWISGGLLENAGGKAVAAASAGVDLTLKADAIGKPDGPPPMPNELPIEPVVHTPRMSAVVGLASSPWAPVIAVAGQKQVLLYSSTNLSLLGILPFSEGQPVDLKFSRSAKLLLAAGGLGAKAGRIVVWDVTTGESFLTVGGEYDTVLSSDIRPDQTQIAFGGPSRLVKIYSIKSGEVQHKIKKHTDWVTAVAFSPNGEMLATADRNGGISIWDPDNAQEMFTLAGHKSAVTALSWRGDSKLLASSSEDGTVKLWEMKEGKQAKSWNAHGSGALSVAFSHEGNLVSCGRDNSVILWDSNGSKTRAMTAAPELPLRVCFSSDNERIFATDFSGRVTVFNAKDGKKSGELDPNPLPLADQLVAAQQLLADLQTVVIAKPANVDTNAAVSKNESVLTDAKAAVARLQAAQVLSSAYTLRQSLAAKKREQAAASPPPKKITAEISADQSRLDQLLQKYRSLLASAAVVK
jgi:WD40 repeat protein